MTVYIEYVIIDNVIIDYLILKATLALTGNPYRRGRLFLCSILGATVALIYPLLSQIKWISIAVKILAGLTMLLLASNYKSIKNFYVCALVFFAITFLMGGAIIGIFNLLSIPYSNEISIALMFVPIYFIYKFIKEIVKYVKDRLKISSLTYQIQAVKGDKEIRCLGFMDTGNSAFDGDSPIILCNQSLAKKILDKDIITTKFKKIKISTANGESQNLAFKIDKIIIYEKDKPYIYNDVTVCIINLKISGYDVILHPALIKEIDYNENDRAVKKVC